LELDDLHLPVLLIAAVLLALRRRTEGPTQRIALVPGLDARPVQA